MTETNDRGYGYTCVCFALQKLRHQNTCASCRPLHLIWCFRFFCVRNISDPSHRTRICTKMSWGCHLGAKSAQHHDWWLKLGTLEDGFWESGHQGQVEITWHLVTLHVDQQHPTWRNGTHNFPKMTKVVQKDHEITHKSVIGIVFSCDEMRFACHFGSQVCRCPTG